MKDLFCKIIDLFLTSEKSSADWVKIPSLRNSMLFVGVSGLILAVLVFFCLIFPANGNANTVFVLRSCKLFGILLFATAFLVVNFNYFRYVLEKNYRIRLDIVIFFYFFHIVLWGSIYSDIYFLFPDFYIYQNPPVGPSQEFIRTFKVGLVRLHFLIFSAFQSLNANFYRILPNSIIPSILSWIQSLYTLSILALLIASYVNQKAHPMIKKYNDCSAERINSAVAKKPRR